MARIPIILLFLFNGYVYSQSHGGYGDHATKTGQHIGWTIQPVPKIDSTEKFDVWNFPIHYNGNVIIGDTIAEMTKTWKIREVELNKKVIKSFKTVKDFTKWRLHHNLKSGVYKYADTFLTIYGTSW